MTQYPHCEEAGLKVESGKVKIVCARCMGSGNYSFNMMYGTVCFGCGGAGHLGWRDAASYEKTLARREKQRQYRAKKKAEKAAKAKAKAEVARDKFLQANPGLAEALKCEHKILADLDARLSKWGELSEKQVALALKLGHEAKNPTCGDCGHGEHEFGCDHEGCECVAKAEVECGRRTMTGKVLTCQLRATQYGDTVKMLVKLTTGERLWGSMPSKAKTMDGENFKLRDWEGIDGDRYEEPNYPLKGRTVRFTATVEASSKDKYFGFFKRPTDCRVL